MTDDFKHSTQYYVKYIYRAILANLQHRPLKLSRLIVLRETHLWLWKFCSHDNLASPHPLDINMLVIFSLKNAKQGLKLEVTYLYAGWTIPTTTNNKLYSYPYIIQ